MAYYSNRTYYSQQPCKNKACCGVVSPIVELWNLIVFPGFITLSKERCSFGIQSSYRLPKGREEKKAETYHPLFLVTVSYQRASDVFENTQYLCENKVFCAEWVENQNYFPTQVKSIVPPSVQFLWQKGFSWPIRISEDSCMQ